MSTRPQPTLQEKVLGEDDFIVSKTDLKGLITYGNRTFIQMSGYSEAELLGAPHNILRHPDMPRVVFKLLWDTIQAQQEICAYVKNLAKDGSFYWSGPTSPPPSTGPGASSATIPCAGNQGPRPCRWSKGCTAPCWRPSAVPATARRA